ncbi:MAG: TRAP transporter large permease [Stomatobaculum sp.]
MAAMLVFIVFLVGIALSIPIGVSMILGSVTPIMLLGKGGSIVQVLNNTFSGANSTPILAVPLFILGGVIMAEGGISKKLFNFFAYFVGRFPGGVPCAVIMTCLFYGAISGSGPATTAAVGAMCIPFMVGLGYDKIWSAGLISVAGGLGVIIPPSIPFVLYSLATGVSTGALFLAGIIPGIMIGLFMMIYAVFYCITKGEDRALINQKMKELSANGFLALFKDSFWALLCPIIVLGGIYAGYVTPTEAATVSVFYALIVSLFIYKSINIADMWRFLCASVKTYGGLAFVLAFATAFGRVLSLTKATKVVQDFILGNFHSGFAVLSVCVVVFLILGMVMDTGPAIIILAPVLLPAVMGLGVSDVHFGVVLVCCLSIGLATPPFGLDMFVAGNLAQAAPMDVAKKSVPFIVSFLIALAMITYIPALSTFLPSL